MNGNESEAHHNKATISMVGDASHNNVSPAEQNLGKENDDHDNRDYDSFDTTHSNRPDTLQRSSVSPLPTKELKNVKGLANQNIKLEESSNTSLILEEPSESKASKLENVDLAATVGGSQTRRYLNAKVTPHLLAGMRLIAVEQPDDPLRVLGEYLIEQSKIRKSGESESNASA
ncbi:Sdc1p SKDI_04G6720 [Saccharomyces kudriavzevii IFO 1802]|uniref:SDC1-like protein n=2 Tax=Saccharomyces kudriavzevii (strain ATCC MYA-4449 / AS 2.2408 / CBS 8840 / NBRC 1802 / NCYC 2889) TaxID=226230 RepID=A0AA35JH72_SACK1|nr:uncharacterized protein SKDI_04G6720 [Saccharomyces kudriavzevii IFO 1802]CAI4059400.1 hypothetical protein SKDI_04G6720 [Saccharomyces kudriavzevii IFO 1802]